MIYKSAIALCFFGFTVLNCQSNFPILFLKLGNFPRTGGDIFPLQWGLFPIMMGKNLYRSFSTNYSGTESVESMPKKEI